MFSLRVLFTDQKWTNLQKFIKLRKEYIITVHITLPTPFLNSPPCKGLLFKNYFILVTKLTNYFIEETISSRKNKVRLIKARKNDILSTFWLSVTFFNKKDFSEVREGTERTRTYKLSTSSYTHTQLPTIQVQGMILWFKTRTIENTLILYFKFTKKQVIHRIRIEQIPREAKLEQTARVRWKRNLTIC